jgi:hypothetical protein
LTATNGVVSWSSSGGSLTGQTSNAAIWHAPNVSGVYLVTATNASGSDTLTVTVISLAVANPSWKYSGDYDRKFLTWTPDSGPSDRVEVIKGPYLYTLEMTANSRQKAEFLLFLAHHRAHYGLNVNFYFTHPDTSVEYLMMYDAKLKEEWARPNLVAYSTVLKQVS